MKKILFVINTLGRAGAETALLELLRRLDAEEYEISLYVLLGQGEMISQVPQRVHVKNKKICTASVLSGAGRRKLIQTSFLAFFRHGRTIKKMQYVIQNFFRMKKTGNIQPDKLLWRVISDGADRFSETFDLAVAYLEGGSAYYVADHVNAKKKAAFVHIAYGNSGYTREMDRDCYEKMDQIFTVSQETRRHFLEFYPEYEKKVQVFHNILDTDRIAREAQLPGAKENLFPYYAQCDLYVHATRFEGKSIAIQEAQTLGCAVIASDCAGNREQIVDGEDGLLCTLTPEGIAEKVEELLDDPKKRERLAAAAKQKMNGQTEEIWKLLNLMK
jgi:glycosyltransferase involved in cell wall biosynthesis